LRATVLLTKFFKNALLKFFGYADARIAHSKTQRNCLFGGAWRDCARQRHNTQRHNTKRAFLKNKFGNVKKKLDLIRKNNQRYAFPMKEFSAKCFCNGRRNFSLFCLLWNVAPKKET
jgi:hypothetical protein